MARFEAPLEDDGLNESQPGPTPDGEPAAILDDSPEIEDLVVEAQDDPAAVSAQRTAHAQYGDTHAMNEAAPCPQHAMSSADEAAVGSASGEPKRQGTLDDWNHLEFLRNTWNTP